MNKYKKIGWIIMGSAYLSMLALIVLGKIIPNFIMSFFGIGSAIVIFMSILNAKNYKVESNEKKWNIVILYLGPCLFLTTILLFCMR